MALAWSNQEVVLAQLNADKAKFVFDSIAGIEGAINRCSHIVEQVKVKNNAPLSLFQD